MKKIVSDLCEDDVIHVGVVEKVRAAIPDEDVLVDVAELFKVFGDSTRTRILSALFVSELCVCDIAELLGMTVSAISHQLRVLKQSSLVKYRKSGKSVLYSLADDHVHTILGQGMEHIREPR